MGYSCLLKFLGCVIIAGLLITIKNNVDRIGRINLIKRFDRSFSTKTLYQLFWLAIILALTFIVMCIIAYFLFDNTPFVDDEKNFSPNYNLLEYVAAIMLDPGQIDHIKNGPEHQWSLLLGLLGVIAVTGITISTITNIVQRRVNQYLNGEVRYKFSNHIVVIGFGEIAMAIIDQICKSDDFEKSPKDILIMSNQNSNEIRQSINTIVDKKNENYIYVYRGRKDSCEDLDSLYIENAFEVFLLGEKDEKNRDATNMEALRKIAGTTERLYQAKKELSNHSFSSIKKSCSLDNKISRWENRKEKRIPITVLFNYQSTYAIFQITDLSKEWNEFIEFRPFNFYENWAKKLLFTRTYNDINRHLLSYPSLDQPRNGDDNVGISENSDKYVHLVIFGMSSMGVALGTMAAQMCHFPNFNTKRKKTQITFITPDADTEMLFFKGRYSHFFEIAPSYYRDFISENGKPHYYPPTLHKDLANLLDVEFTFIRGKAEQPEIREVISQWATEKQQLLTIAVCLKEPSKNMAIGLYMPDCIYDNNIPVFIRQKSSGALLSLLNENDKDSQYIRYRNVYPFGMLEDCYDLTYSDVEAAKLFNYYYNKTDEPLTRENLDKMWKELSIALQWSNLYIRYSTKFKLHSIGIKEKDITNNNNVARIYNYRELTPEETMILARVEQNRWMVEKLLLGYRALHKEEWEELEKVKNSEKDLKKHKENLKNRFIHPAICPYDDLDEKYLGFNAAMSSCIPEILNHLERNDIK